MNAAWIEACVCLRVLVYVTFMIAFGVSLSMPKNRKQHNWFPVISTCKFSVFIHSMNVEKFSLGMMTTEKENFDNSLFSRNEATKIISHNCPFERCSKKFHLILRLSPHSHSFLKIYCQRICSHFSIRKIPTWEKSQKKAKHKTKIARINILWLKSMQIGSERRQNSCLLMKYERNNFNSLKITKLNEETSK